MKKSVARLLTLVLVLAMIVSIVPVALADEVDEGTPSLTITGATEAVIGDSVELTAEAQNAPAGATIEWSTGATGASITVEITEAGDKTVSATLKDSEGKDLVTADHTITVAGTPSVTATGGSVYVNEKKVFPVTYSNVPADGKTGCKIVEGQGKVDYGPAGDGIEVTGLEEGTAKLRAYIESADGKELAGADFTVTVLKTSYAISVPSKANMVSGSKYTITPEFEPELPEDFTVHYDLKSNNTKVCTVSGNEITAVASGNTTVTGTITVKNADNEVVVSKDVSVSVSVSSMGITCDVNDVQLGDTTKLTPTIKDLPQGADVTFTFTPGSSKVGRVSVKTANDGKSATITGEAAGLANVTITAKITNTETEIEVAPLTVYVGVYDDSTEIKASTNQITFDLSDEKALTSLYKDGKAAASDISLISAMSAPDAAYIKITPYSGTTVGTFSHRDWVGLNNISFTATNSGTIKAEYVVGAYVDGTFHVVGGGILELTVGDYEGDITYETNASGKATFDEDDFIEFWNDNKKAFKCTGDLAYVMFSDENLPKYGMLYQTSEGKNVVSTSHRCYPEYNKTNNNYYCDLDTVTYIVDDRYSSDIADTVPFTAYGEKSGEKMTGNVIINGKGEVIGITSRGVVFGSSTYEVTELIEDIYKTNNNQTLGYVTFPTLSASKGKLFYDFSSVLESDRVEKNAKYYAAPSKTQLDLDKVAFVPRAGLYGEVKIDYVAYDVNGKNEYAGTLTFNVTEKTKSAKFSDVNASSYSWAADSVDFLYYEGVANGSNGKYNPASNITRGDFMLMLYRAFLEDEYEDYNVTSNFPDVVKGSDSYSKETYQAVGVAKHLGIAQGTNGKYNPKAYITREEAMTLIYRTLDEVDYSMSYESSNDTSDFKDYSSVASYAKTAISDLIEHGVVVGNNGKINPKSNITRAEMAVILHRVLTY